MVERRIDDACAAIERMEGKLDAAISQKADKADVDTLRARMWAVAIGLAAFLGVTLVGLVTFVIYEFIRRGIAS